MLLRITNLRKIRSCPELRMSSPISPQSIQKEIIIGTALAVTSIFITGHHHTYPNYSELETSISAEIINSISELHYNDKTKSSRAYKLKKRYLFLLIAFMPFIIRILSFTLVAYCL